MHLCYYESRLNITIVRKHVGLISMFMIGVAALSLITISALSCGESSPEATSKTTPLPFVGEPRVSATPTTTPLSSVGAWKQDTAPADLLTGRELMDVVLESSDLGGVRLIVRCTYNSAVERENGLDVIISWGEDIGSNYEPTVAVRFDEGDIHEGSWSLSTDSEATSAPDVDSFTSSMKSASRLVARVWRKDQSTITAQWGVDGFTEAVKPVEEKCGPIYTPPPTRIPPSPVPTRIPPTPVPTSPPGAEVLELSIKNFQHVDATVKAGTVVMWTNNDRPLHTVTHINTGGERLFHSNTIAPDAGFRFHFTKPGIYEYQCLIHPVNMKGTITVTE